MFEEQETRDVSKRWTLDVVSGSAGFAFSLGTETLEINARSLFAQSKPGWSLFLLYLTFSLGLMCQYPAPRLWEAESQSPRSSGCLATEYCVCRELWQFAGCLWSQHLETKGSWAGAVSWLSINWNSGFRAAVIWYSLLLPFWAAPACTSELYTQNQI